MSVKPERRVVVVGGGFAGIGIAKKLDGSCEVTVVEQCAAYHIPIPSVRAIVDDGWAWKQFVPYDKTLRRGKVVQNEATGMLLSDEKQPQVLLADGSSLPCEAVVMAIGAKVAFPARRSPAPVSERVATYRACKAAIEKAKSCVIIGGGAVGVEIAGEIATATACEVTLVHSGPRLLVGSAGGSDAKRDKLSAAAAKFLTELGVTLIFDDKVAKNKLPKGFLDLDGPIPLGGTVATAKGAEVAAELGFWCCGNSFAARDVFDMLECTSSGKLKVDDHLLVEKQTRVFAAGEVADFPGCGDREWSTPAIDAMVATVAANVKAVLAGKAPRKTYKRPFCPTVISVGPKKGVLHLPTGHVFTGTSFPGNLKNRLGFFMFKIWPQIGGRKCPKQSPH